MKSHLLILFILISPNIMNSQNYSKLSQKDNKLHQGDAIIKQQVEFKEPGASGKNILWDFSNLSVINDKYRIDYFLPDPNDSSQILGREHDTNYIYHYKSDSLFIVGYYNRTASIQFSKPELIIKFPLNIGDTVESAFNSNGYYCQTIPVKSNGHIHINADAIGQIITPEGDTVKNVIRISRIKDFEQIGIDSTTMHMENYVWYAKGYRYPVFETIKSYSIKKDSLITNLETSFYYSLIKREDLHLTDMGNIDNYQSDKVIINCITYPNPVINDVIISYTLNINAFVSYKICDAAGKVWVNIQRNHLEAGTQTKKVAMTGLPQGNYCLYIQINDLTHKQTIIKK